MTNDDQKKKIITGVVAAGAVIAAGYVLYKATKGGAPKESGDDVAWKAPTQQPQKVVSSGKEETAKKPKKEQQKAPQGEGQQPKASSPKVEEPEDEEEEAPELVVAQQEGKLSEFPDLGVSLGEMGNWSVHLDEEGQAVVSMNNSAILRFLHVQYSPMLGDQPLGNLLVEDMQKEHYATTKECSNAQLQRSMQQELPEGMPPQMAEMLKPKVVKSEPVSVGPFDFELVYDQQGPGMFLRSRQLQKLQDGVLYTWQVAGPHQLMDLIEKEMDEAAKAITITGRPDKPAGKQIYTSAKAKIQISVPFHWVSGKAPANVGDFEGLISWDTNAEDVARRDEIKLYAGKTSGEELAKAVQAALDAKAALKEVNGVWTFTTRQGTRQSQVYVKDSVILQVVAAKDSIKTAPESDIIGIISTVAPATGEEELRAYSPQLKVSFKVQQGSTIVEGSLADPQLTYAVSREEGAHSLIIAMPQADPNKPPPEDIPGWYARIEEEFPQTDTSRIENKQIENVAGREAVAFCTREMVPAGGFGGMFTGASEEHKAKMYVMMHNNHAYLIRYATATGEFRRIEQTMKAVIGSLKFEE